MYTYVCLMEKIKQKLRCVTCCSGRGINFQKQKQTVNVSF